MIAFTLSIPHNDSLPYDGLTKLSSLPGVKKSSVNNEAKTITIEYDETLISKKKIAKKLHKEVIAIL